ncbi:MAG TPA: zinc-binding dehydrogenase [Ardenticatenaceae bacterium]|jgi:NADPH:quinone reductase-like Zn-dependent oxidoreductase
MSTMRAVVVTPDAAARLALTEVERPTPQPNQALVRVAAVSLNRGEVRGAQRAQPGHRPGWDLAGTIEQAAEDGSGPQEGARVVGFLVAHAWAEYAAVATDRLAELPDDVTFAQAATLPVAGLTALQAIGKGGDLLERRVLITGASGGVGYFAVQLARHAGAHVVGQVRAEERAALVREAGAHHVALSEDASAAEQYGPYHLIIDGVGGSTLSTALPLLAPEGICVNYGGTAGFETTIELGRFYATGGLRLYGLYVFHELKHEPASIGLARLARMVADGRLRPLIEVEANWSDVGDVAQRLLDRQYAGKAVLHIQ